MFEKYEKLNVIGKGYLNRVFKGQNKNTKEYVAIKEIILKEIKIMEVKKEGEKEIKIMKLFNFCPNSVKLIDNFEENNIIYLVMELCDGNITKYLNKSKNGFNMTEIKIVMKQFNNILKELRKRDMIHNDLRLENILVKFKENSKEFEIKLSDYCMCKLLSNKKDLSNNEWGIEPYTEGSEEDIELQIKLDLLMIGIDIYRMIFNEPYDTYEEMIEKVDQNVEDKNLKDLLNKLLTEDSDERIGWEDYFNHDFFKIKKYDFDKVENIVKK